MKTICCWDCEADLIRFSSLTTLNYDVIILCADCYRKRGGDPDKPSNLPLMKGIVIPQKPEAKP